MKNVIRSQLLLMLTALEDFKPFTKTQTKDITCWYLNFIVDLIAEKGFSAFACADIAEGLLNYRRVMAAYYDTYTSPEPVNEFMRDMNVKASIPIFRELLIPSGSEPQDVRDMAAFFASMQRQERRKGGPVSRRTKDTHKLIRYQRNGIARLSRTGSARLD